MHMMLLVQAYYGFKDQLKSAIEMVDARKANVCLLRDIEFLCEFAIPAVLISSVIESVFPRSLVEGEISEGVNMTYLILNKLRPGRRLWSCPQV